VPAASGTTLVKSLSELLQAANTEGLSARSIARQAQALGYSLNHDTAARYLRGDHGRPDEDTLLALASVLKLPLAPLRKAAQLPSEVTEPYRPPPEASRLSRRQRRAVDEIIRAMLETGRTASNGPVGSQAARRGDAEPPAR
jgi:transcriptional regulator with XRE-family HTH domain